jgi:hypothetical protein
MPTAVGCGAFIGVDSKPEKKYFSEIRVPAFRLTSTSTESWPGSSSMSGTYIGPATASDITRTVTAPGLVLEPSSRGITPQPSDAFYPIAQGRVQHNCMVLVDGFRRNAQVSPSWKISNSQLGQLRDGDMNLFKITVNCGNG